MVSVSVVALKVIRLEPVRPATEPVTLALVLALCCACWAIACALCTSLVSEVRPLLAACNVWVAFEMESSSELKSLARSLSDCEVKKLIGLSSAELTFLPVARRFCVSAIRLAVFCSESRFCRTPAVSVISAMNLTFLVRCLAAIGHVPIVGLAEDHHEGRIMAVRDGKRMWLMS